MINLIELNYKDEILIDNDYEIESRNSSVKRLENIHFNGRIYNSDTEEIILSGILTGQMIMYDSIDLSDYPLDLNLEIEEIIDKNEKMLDINQILWQNIVLEIPMRATKCENTVLKGEGWEMKNEETRDEDEIDPRLAKLQDLFKGGE